MNSDDRGKALEDALNESFMTERSVAKPFLMDRYRQSMIEMFIKQYRHELHKRRMWQDKMRKRKVKRKSK